MFGRQRDGLERPAAMDLVRLAMPRRVYTQSHADHIARTFAAIAAAPEKLKGYRIVWEPQALRHFTARFEPLGSGTRVAPSVRSPTELRASTGVGRNSLGRMD